MNLLCIDPGPTKSGWLILEDGQPVTWGWDENDAVLAHIKSRSLAAVPHILVIEDVTHMGMAVGKDVFETVRWSGRFDADQRAVFIDRKQVKLTLCGNPQAKDPNIRAACIDRFGGDSVAIGGKKCATCHGKGWRGRDHAECGDCAGSGYESAPGVLKGISAHVWSALAIGLTYLEQQK